MLEGAMAPKEALADLHLQIKMKRTRRNRKILIVRRESFDLPRKNSTASTSPFIDDFVVPPALYPEFLPKLNAS